MGIVSSRIKTLYLQSISLFIKDTSPFIYLTKEVPLEYLSLLFKLLRLYYTILYYKSSLEYCYDLCNLTNGPEARQWLTIREAIGRRTSGYRKLITKHNLGL